MRQKMKMAARESYASRALAELIFELLLTSLTVSFVQLRLPLQLMGQQETLQIIRWDKSYSFLSVAKTLLDNGVVINISSWFDTKCAHHLVELTFRHLKRCHKTIFKQKPPFRLCWAWASGELLRASSLTSFCRLFRMRGALLLLGRSLNGNSPRFR